MTNKLKEPEAKEKGICSGCGKQARLVKVKVADDDGVRSIYVCKACAGTVGTR